MVVTEEGGHMAQSSADSVMKKKNGHSSTSSAKQRPAGRREAHGRDESLDPAVHTGSTERRARTPARKGIALERRFTQPGADPLDQVRWERRSSIITNPDGSIVFKMEGAEIPADWSQLATDIVISKYFRKAGLYGDKTQGERSVRQVVHRIAHTIRRAGEEYGGYFASKADADTFEAELSFLLVHQYGAFNSPVWFNCGLWHEYGIVGSGGNWAWDMENDDGVKETQNAYERPQCSACFIQHVKDDLMAIYDLVKSEARLFKYGSGTGSNFSNIRGKQEKLSGGGTSSGLMSFLEVFDRAAGATKSGGTTRRAAKMVCLDMDHPEIVDFINWKVREEKKAHALIAAGFSADFNGEAYHTISGQNSNNSVRVSDEFMRAVMAGAKWKTIARTTHEVIDEYDAKDLWRQIAQAAWHCADPGVQYDTTINRWHTCPNTGKINASNPCVTGDTLVATKDGLMRIDALLGEATSVVGADGKLHAIAPAFPTGTKPVYRLVTSCGFEVRLTGDHRVLTKNRGDVQACELTKDDAVVLGRPAFGARSLDGRIAELVGLMLGEGCMIECADGQRIATLTLGKDEEAVARHVHESLATWQREAARDGREARDTEVREAGETLRMRTSSRRVIEEIERYAVLDGGSENKALKPVALGLDEASLAALLRGLFTTCGTVANYGDNLQYVGLYSTSLVLLQQVQQLLLAFGIKGEIYRDRRVAGQTMALLPDGKGGRREHPVRQVHSLRISRSSRVLFEQKIGFTEGSAKREQLAALGREMSTYDDAFVDTVESLTFVGEEPVFDLTEPVTHHFVANGLVVHNCSEYMFLDDSACNLASVNLTKFLKQDGSFDIDGYRHACRIFFIAQEILVDLSAYPTKEIAKNSHDYRPLGLGYANLGSLLMLMGVPYDSDKGRAVCAALTAIMCGHAYRTSAEMAATKGPFAGFAKNREPMLRVMGMHRDAAYAIRRDECPPDLWRAATEDWDRAIELGTLYGYRNAQATVLAPTGTIGLLMDCDTTGIEPDFALVKFKKLAGGGYFKIVNQSVPHALERLGYSQAEIQDIVAYVTGTNTLLGAPHVNRRTLKERGFSDEDLAKVEGAIPGVFDLPSAFATWVLGEETYDRLGATKEVRARKGFSLLEHLGFSRAEIEEAESVIIGRMTIEGAPHLREDHYPVFDCANRCGKTGQRFLAPMSHIKMMAAAQPFLSGAISKTVNLPNEATVDDVQKIYEEGWRLGLKAVALYRDGCKASQPLSTKSDAHAETKAETRSDAPLAPMPATEGPQDSAQLSLPLTRPHGVRVRLPKKRSGFTQEATVGGHKIFLRTGEYIDGTLGEIFIDMHKEGAAFRSLMNCFAMSVSIGLQYGVPLETYVDQFTFTRFEPQGSVQGHPNVKFATSIVDYIFRVLGVEYLGRYDLAHVKPEDIEAPAPRSAPSTRDVAPAPITEAPAPSSLAYTPAAIARSASEQEATGSPTAAGYKQQGSVLDQQLDAMMGDAPVCDVCGHITVRNGACYKCLNCGNSMGCS
jgi:ribonucleoside-diphosphate reductase alpha chain